MARFANAKAPFVRLADEGKSTDVVMRDFMIALIPVILFAWFKNGILVYIEGNNTFLEMLYPLFYILAGGVFSVLMEMLFFYITDPEARTLQGIGKHLKTSYAVFPGLILALLLPLYTPIWVLLFGTFMATIVAKMLFGGFGYNLFNPAIIGYIAITYTFAAIMKVSYLNPSEVIALDAVAGATPLTWLSQNFVIDYNVLVAPYGNLWDFFLGTIPGTLGETSALVILISFAWMAFRKVYKWWQPMIYIGVVFVLTWLIGIFNGEAGLWFPTYGVLSGGLMYGAVFMSTEPVTTPRNPLGKVYNALFLGALTVLFRYVGTFPEGVATAIIVMNIFTMPLDRATASIRSTGLKKPVMGKFLFLTLLVLALMVYGVLKSANLYSAMAVFLGGVF
ncbi:MAG: RnfABCDGE type electron transport complex subunit D [Candidatus Izemoplasmatales bacterium]|nr:RnfABCDGE type electron transport complex subunit D [Candidatus Izemoplasmatales bacterium]